MSEKPESKKAGVVTRGAWAKMQKESGPDLDPVKEDDGMGQGLQLTSCVSEMIGDASYPQGESQAHDISPEAVEDETDEGESPPDRKSFSAKDLLKLNIDIVLHLFKFMKPEDILKASQTCWLWREWGEDQKVWELKCKEADLAFSLTPADIRALERRKAESTITYSTWKANFLKPYKIAKNFREGDPKMFTIEINHEPPPFPDELLLEFSNDKIAIVPGEHFKHIHIFCALSGILLHELVGHTKVVLAIQMDQEFVVSSSDGGIIKVWNVETGTLIHTIIDNPYAYLDGLKMHGPIVVSWSGFTLRMWNVREGRLLHSLTGHTSSVKHVQFNGKFVVSGSRDRSIKIWDAGTGECVRTLSLDAPFRDINSLEFNGVHVVAGSWGGIFIVWDVETGVRRYFNKQHTSGPFVKMKMQGNMMVCNNMRTADIWDISTGVRLHTLAGPHKHKYRIHIRRDIQVTEKFVLTNSDDETVELWDIKSGEFIRDLVLGSSLGEEKTIDREQEVEVSPTIIRMKNAKIVGAVSSSRRSQLLVLNFDPNDDEN